MDGEFLKYSLLFLALFAAPNLGVELGCSPNTNFGNLSTDNEIIVSSPGFDDGQTAYAANKNCFNKIFVPAMAKFVFEFEYFDVSGDQEDDCSNGDFLKLNFGHGYTFKICGNQPAKIHGQTHEYFNYKSEEGFVAVSFQANSNSAGAKGYKIRFLLNPDHFISNDWPIPVGSPISGADLITSAENKALVLTSPGFQFYEHYQRTKILTHKVEVPANTRVIYQFDFFLMGPGKMPNCIGDKLVVSSNIQKPNPTMIYCGDYAGKKHEFINDKNETVNLLFKFVSDGLATDDDHGFKLKLFTQALCNCGQNSLGGSSRIINGTEALAQEFPWEIGLVVFDKATNMTFMKLPYICGSSMISPNTILTAAHCAQPMKSLGAQGWGLAIVAGRNGNIDLLKVIPADAIEVSPQQIYVHENYVNVFGGKDIAIIKLQSPIPISSRVSPVCLPRGSQEFFLKGGENVTAVGWGKINETNYFSETLMKVDLTISSECKFVDVVCAGDENGNVCNGDSGSSLVQMYQRRQYLAGITSFGDEKCGTPDARGTFSYFTRVLYYLNWIARFVPYADLLSCSAPINHFL